MERDVRLTVNVRDPSAFRPFLSPCAGHAGQLLNTARLGADCGISHGTVRAWLSVLDTGLPVRRLQIETPDQWKVHPLRGAGFENWVLVELLKSYLNRGQEAQMFFGRDHVGHEVGLLRDCGTPLDVWECRSGMTYDTEWTEGLDYWSRLAGVRAGRLNLVYGGRESFTHRDVQVAGWADVPATASQVGL